MFERGSPLSVSPKGEGLNPWVIDILHCPLACLVVEERVVGNLEEPRTELSLVLIAGTGEVSLHQRILRQVVGIVFLTTAESE